MSTVAAPLARPRGAGRQDQPPVPPPPDQAAVSPLRDPFLWTLLAGYLLISGWYLLGWGSRHVDASLFWLTQAVWDVVFAVGAYRSCRVRVAPDTTRRFWRKAILVGVLFTIGDSFQAIHTMVGPAPTATTTSTSTGEVQSMLLLAGSVWFLIAVLTHPVRLSGRERLRFALDVSTIMAGTAMFVWYVVNQAERTSTNLLQLVSQSTIALVIVFAMVRLLLAGNSPFTKVVGVMGGLAITMLVANDSAAVALDSAHSGAGLAVRLIPCLLIAAGPRVQELQIRANPRKLAPRRSRPYSLLAYGAVACAQILLVVQLREGGLDGAAWGMVAGSMVVLALVVIRQQVAFVDNARLLAEVDQGMVSLRQQRERLRALVQHSAEIIAVLDTDWRVTYVSPAIERVLGVPPADAIGQQLGHLLDPGEAEGSRAEFEAVLETPGSCLARQLRVRHVDGSWRWISLVVTNMLDTPGIGGVVCNARDVTETVAFQQRLRFEATHDPLTLLANRTLLEERIRARMAAQDGEAVDGAVMLMIDLDDFKLVNDTYGHHAGDQLLTEVAERLSNCSRSGDTVARFGGDEFAVLLPGSTLDDGVRIAERILAALEESVVVEGHPLRVRASIGVAAGAVSDAQALMRAADSAMYAAKQRGKDTYVTATV